MGQVAESHDLRRALRRLWPGQRTALALFYYLDLLMEEVAQVLLTSEPDGRLPRSTGSRPRTFDRCCAPTRAPASGRASSGFLSDFGYRLAGSKSGGAGRTYLGTVPAGYE